MNCFPGHQFDRDGHRTRLREQQPYEDEDLDRPGLNGGTACQQHPDERPRQVTSPTVRV